MKQIDPQETYVVRMMFGCGEGHALPPGFTHWESGEACIHGHELKNQGVAYYHFYWRLYLVPMFNGSEKDRYDPNSGLVWERVCAHPNRFGQYIVAPPGLKEGQVIQPGSVAA